MSRRNIDALQIGFLFDRFQTLQDFAQLYLRIVNSSIPISSRLESEEGYKTQRISRSHLPHTTSVYPKRRWHKVDNREDASGHDAIPNRKAFSRNKKLNLVLSPQQDVELQDPESTPTSHIRSHSRDTVCTQDSAVPFKKDDVDVQLSSRVCSQTYEASPRRTFCLHIECNVVRCGAVRARTRRKETRLESVS